jgi:hypothetical protein
MLQKHRIFPGPLGRFVPHFHASHVRQRCINTHTYLDGPGADTLFYVYRLSALPIAELSRASTYF